MHIGTEPSVVLDCHNCLGEGIVWDDGEQVLWWISIQDGEIWRWDPFAEAAPKVIRLPERIGSLGLRESGGLVLALASGFAFFDPQSERLERVVDVEADIPATRLNDGRIDAAGRFVCGGIDEGNPPKRLASVYSFGTDRKVTRLFGDVICANSICWSPDGATMYFADTPTKRIETFDYDLATGALANRRTLVDLTGVPGGADGSTVDAEGCLWNAEWGGNKLVRYRPDGQVDREVKLPVSNPTCMAFGGPDLDVLFVTTAWFTLSDEQRAKEPHAGSLFAFRPGVRGRREHRYAG